MTPQASLLDWAPSTRDETVVDIPVGDEPWEDTGGEPSFYDDEPEPLPLLPELRTYQREAIHGGSGHPGVLAALQDVRSALLVMATGTGKTTVFSEVAKLWPGRVLVLAHREELIAQARARIELVTGERADIEKANWHASNSARLVVGCVPTLKGWRLKDWSKNHFGLIVVDECHHGASKSYQAILEHFSDAKVLGVTATPDRSDRLALGKTFESVAYVYDIVDAIKDRHLVPIVGKTIALDVDLSEVKTMAGDLNQGQLDEKMSDEHVLEGVALPTMEHAKERPTIVFTTSVANAHSLARIMNAKRHDCARAVDGETKQLERKEIMEGFRNGAFQFLVNCGIATEGFDAPRAACIAIGRPTKSRSLFVQMVGRGLRPHDASGKSDCLVLDFAGNAGKHNLCTPFDILGGKYKEAEVERAKKLAKKNARLTVGEALEQARAELISEEEAKKRAAKKIKHKSSSFDPFSSLQAEEEDRKAQALDWNFGAQPPTPGQVEIIQRAGLTIGSMTRRQASALISGIMERRKKGLCSLPQLKVLKRAGIEAQGMSFEQASREITRLKANGWRRT